MFKKLLEKFKRKSKIDITPPWSDAVTPIAVDVPEEPGPIHHEKPIPVDPPLPTPVPMSVEEPKKATVKKKTTSKAKKK